MADAKMTAEEFGEKSKAYAEELLVIFGESSIGSNAARVYALVTLCGAMFKLIGECEEYTDKAEGDDASGYELMKLALEINPENQKLDMTFCHFAIKEQILTIKQRSHVSEDQTKEFEGVLQKLGELCDALHRDYDMKAFT